jgi:ribosomal protein L40E
MDQDMIQIEICIKCGAEGDTVDGQLCCQCHTTMVYEEGLS